MPRKILVIGAGKSTSYLLDYLLEKSRIEDLHLTLGDLDPGAIADGYKEPSHIAPLFPWIFLRILSGKKQFRIRHRRLHASRLSAF